MHYKLLLLPLSLFCACAAPIPQVSYSDLSLMATGPLEFEAPSRSLATAQPRKGPWVGSNYTSLKLGTFHGAGDLSGQDTGLASELVFGREIFRFLAIEAATGYVQADGPDVDMWGIPIFLQARLSMPIAIFEPYLGVGIGGFYADLRSPNAPAPAGGGGGGGGGGGTGGTGGGGAAEDGPGTDFPTGAAGKSGSGFIGAGTVFVGAEVGLGNWALGIEAKYIKTETVDSFLAVEGTSVMISGMIPF